MEKWIKADGGQLINLAHVVKFTISAAPSAGHMLTAITTARPPKR
jgi:hypothetical protein